MALILQQREEEDIVFTIPPSNAERVVVLFKAKNGNRFRLGIVAPNDIKVQRVPSHKSNTGELDVQAESSDGEAA